MKDYYGLLGINEYATHNQILEAYKNKIARFNNLPFHTKKMIEDIKSLKEALYVLTDDIKRLKYNLKRSEENKYNSNDESVFDNTKICNRLFSITFNK